MARQLQPLYLLADSQLLFWKRQDRLLLDAALDGLARDTPLSAAYIGASNGDRPEFYGIFEAAVDAIGITYRRMIDSSFGPDDRAFMERAQLIVLAGGDVRLGWNTFEKTGIMDVILGRYAQGAVLVGISAGAKSSSDATESSRHRNPPRPSCSICSSSSPPSSTRTTSEPSGRGCRARFICWREPPPGSESPPEAESSCTRIPPSSLCGVPRTNSVSRALASRTHCCAPQRATDRIQLCEFNLARRERRRRTHDRGATSARTDEGAVVRNVRMKKDELRAVVLVTVAERTVK